ncbi:GNAT family N-acetyltransferase [Desulfurobacterium crinifex]
MKIKVTDGKIYMEFENGDEAFITFGIEEKKKVIVVSTTYVPESQRGKGIAGKLSAKLVEYAEDNGYKIYPLCSYTQKYLERKRPDLIAQ